MVHQKVYELCQSGESVSDLLARDPALAPSHAAEKLFGVRIGDHIKEELFKEPHEPVSAEELERAAQCGKWGSQKPSELFLRIYHDALDSLIIDPLQGMVSPSLMGSCGVVPLTVVSTIPDICRHMSNCIARADSEVILATNFWKHGEATKIIVNGIRELSRRAGEAGERRVVKILYDRGSPKQLVNNHLELSESEWGSDQVKIPPASELPHVDLQVMNYHRPVFGTFHSKFMIVDRRLAVVQSNNLQDNDNLEMMVHLEGPIVDSLYDMALLSWHNAPKPPLPRLNSPAASAAPPAFQLATHHGMFDGANNLKQLLESSHTGVIPNGNAEAVNKVEAAVTNAGEKEDLPQDTSKDPHFDPDIAAEVTRIQSFMSPRHGESHTDAVTRCLNTTIQPDTKGNASECEEGERMTPYIPLPAHDPVPMALVCRKPWGAADLQSLHIPQNDAFLSAFRNAKRTILIQTPNLNAKPLFEAITAACRRGIDVTYYVCLGYNDTGELLPFQGGTNEMFAHRLYRELDESARKHLFVYNYVGKDQMQPIHNKFKKRSCHIKLLIADSQVAIQGSGNQDTQTWFHSQEVNVLTDSPMVCAAWETALRRNENTHLYGQTYQGLGSLKDHEGKERDMGCWYNVEGKQAEGAIGIDPGRFSWARGLVGAVQRVRGVGDF